MLILTRKLNERIFIGDDVVVTVTRIGDGAVKLGFSAPDGVRILREELLGTPEADRVAGKED